jgi:hypothetical protein
MLVGALALSTVAMADPIMAEGPTQWVAKVYVYNADETVMVKSFSAGKDGVLLKFSSKDDCEEFRAQDPGFATSLAALTTFVREKVDPTFVIVQMCEAIPAGAEKI